MASDSEPTPEKPSGTSISAPPQAETCNAPLLNSQNEVRLVEQPHQSQHPNNVDEVGPTEQKANDEVQLSEVNKEVAVTDVPEKLVASLDRHGLLPEQVQQEQIHQNLVPPQLQEQDVPVVENPSTLRIQFSTSDRKPQKTHINLVPPELQEPDAPVVENRVNLPFVLPTHQTTCYPPVFSEPLQSKIQRLRREVEELERSQQHTRLQRKLDLEKDIQQLRDKYEAESQESESRFRSKKNVIDEFLKIMPSQLTGMQQVISQGYVHQHQMNFSFQSIHSLSHSIRPSHVSNQNVTFTPPQAPYFGPLSRPFHVPQATQPASTNQTMQDMSYSYSIRPPHTVGQNVTCTPLVAVQHQSALYTTQQFPPPQPYPILNYHVPRVRPNTQGGPTNHYFP